MKKYLLCSLLSAATVIAVAQNPAPKSSPSYSPEKCTAAFYSRDSVAMQMKGFKPWYDSVSHIQSRKNELQKKYFVATDRYLMATPDSGVKMTPSQQSEYNSAKKETETLLSQIRALTEQSYNIESQYMMPYYDSIHRTAERISKVRNIPIFFEIGENRQMHCPTDQMLMIDITNDIAMSLGFKPHLLRVGTFNADSLLRLMPGYAPRADSTLKEIDVLNKSLKVMDDEIAKMQHELDSLRSGLSNKKIRDREAAIAAKQEERDIFRGYELYKIDLKDSLHTAAYRKKFRVAAASAAKELNCTKYYENEAAHIYWTSQEAEFVDMNAVIAKKLLSDK